MKQTILFSNVIDDISAKNSDCSFNENMAKVLKSAITNETSLVFVNAPGFVNDDLYFEKIVRCFEKIGINFLNKIEISDDSKKSEFKTFPKDRVYFLMGGNPINQMQLIKEYNLVSELKNYDGVVVGFCAGAINLSKYSIITTDDDFKNAFWYEGINRVDISVEPHFAYDDSDFTKNRINEIDNFCKELNTNIFAISDRAVINIIDDKIEYFGDIYKF